MRAAKKTPDGPSPAETAGAAKSVEDYLARVPESARRMLEEIRKLVRANVPPDAIEVFSYGLPGFRYKGSLLWYGAFKNHCGFFPGSPPLLRSLADELKGFKSTKGGVQFPFGKPLPVALVKKIVRLRVAENEARKPT
jgi:uncharacterized protein YdhG (YjbR/CyaY superfamily)